MCAGIYDRAQSAVVTLLALKNQIAHTCKSLLESLEPYTHLKQLLVSRQHVQTFILGTCFKISVMSPLCPIYRSDGGLRVDAQTFIPIHSDLCSIRPLPWMSSHHPLEFHIMPSEQETWAACRHPTWVTNMQSKPPAFQLWYMSHWVFYVTCR